MINKMKLISELEDIIYNLDDKNVADNLINNYRLLIRNFNLDDFRITINKIPLQLIFRHKAFNKKIKGYFNNNSFFLDGKEINPEDINEMVTSFHYIKNT